ncbi:Zn-dependent exopeptidase [Ascodesmis nigricans]|uniref:Zn-dependent exopeptidase n=1 Tax=Ascodesmis nigricans TaxID=341454 RepID=A0A4S2MXJ7_9PEZI|nr:Zn-dependent exopeptidase [Ascodesmis nigricans]
MSGGGPSNNPHPSAADEKAALRANIEIPIPSYEEATTSQAASQYGETNDSPAGPSGVGESSNLLSGYRPPTVESVRNSMESSFLSDYESARSSEGSLQREMIQMDIEEAEEGTRRNPFQKRFGWSISLPRNPFKGWRWPWWRPRWAWGHPRMPDLSFCTTEAAIVPIARLMIVVLALVMVYALFATGILSYPNRLANEYIIPQRLRNYATESLDYANVDHWMKYLSSFNHVAGTKGDLVLAKYVEGKLSSFGFETERVEFPVYMNFPKPGGRRVWMDNSKWEAKLEERKIDKNQENTLVFHGLSKSGTAKGPLVYANYGTREDFARLEQMGINVKGAIVLMRHGGKRTNDGQKVLAAQEKGAVGCLIFTDPKSDGFGWPIDAVRRASVGLRNWAAGDPLSPGYESSPNAKMIPKDRSPALVKIPSLPLSWGDAKPLLEALKGIGHTVDESWKTVISEVFTGDPTKSPLINLQNEQVEQHSHPIWNVGGRIEGRDPHESRLIIGTHRDAWCFGANDPNSGTAVMLEVARVLGSMKQFGWRPLRTIEFYNWDATEYNLMGSTEFVESMKSHTMDALAYINIASAVTGTTFSAAGSPSMTSALAGIMSLIKDPSSQNSTLQDLWGTFEEHPLPGLGGGGDYSPFQHHLGIPSLDLTFTGPYPSGSCYDTYNWIKRQDEFLQYHMSMAKLLILLILDLADTAVAPLSMAHYDLALQRWTTELEQWMPEKARGQVDLQPLKKAVKKASDHVKAFMNVGNEDWIMRDANGFYRKMDDWSIGLRRARTARMRNWERHLCWDWDTQNMEKQGRKRRWGREWFRHLVMGPQEWGGDEPSYFPWIRDAIEKEDWNSAQDHVGKVSHLIEKAARKLLDENKASPTGS